MIEMKYADKVSDLRQSWEGDTLKFHFKSYGIPLDGGITVEDTSSIWPATCRLPR